VHAEHTMAAKAPIASIGLMKLGLVMAPVLVGNGPTASHDYRPRTVDRERNNGFGALDERSFERMAASVRHSVGA